MAKQNKYHLILLVVVLKQVYSQYSCSNRPDGRCEPCDCNPECYDLSDEINCTSLNGHWFTDERIISSVTFQNAVTAAFTSCSYDILDGHRRYATNIEVRTYIKVVVDKSNNTLYLQYSNLAWRRPNINNSITDVLHASHWMTDLQDQDPKQQVKFFPPPPLPPFRLCPDTKTTTHFPTVPTTRLPTTTPTSDSVVTPLTPVTNTPDTKTPITRTTTEVPTKPVTTQAATTQSWTTKEASISRWLCVMLLRRYYIKCLYVDYRYSNLCNYIVKALHVCKRIYADTTTAYTTTTTTTTPTPPSSPPVTPQFDYNYDVFNTNYNYDYYFG